MVLLVFFVIIKSSTPFGKMTVMQRVLIKTPGVTKSFGHIVLTKVALIGLISPKKMGKYEC